MNHRTHEESREMHKKHHHHEMRMRKEAFEGKPGYSGRGHEDKMRDESMGMAPRPGHMQDGR